MAELGLKLNKWVAGLKSLVHLPHGLVGRIRVELEVKELFLEKRCKRQRVP